MSDLIIDNLDQVPTLAGPILGSSVSSFDAPSVAGLALLGAGIGYGVKKIFFDSKKNEEKIQKQKFSGCKGKKCKRNV